MSTLKKLRRQPDPVSTMKLQVSLNTLRGKGGIINREGIVTTFASKEDREIHLADERRQSRRLCS